MKPKVTFVGMHPMWPGILADGLARRFSDRLSATSYTQGAGVRSIPGFAARLATSDLVVRVGVTLDPASRLDRLFMATPALRRRRCCALFWIGTDVLRFAEARSGGHVDERVLHAVTTMPSMTGADHLAKELATVGVQATPVPFPAPVLGAPEVAPPMPDRFRVLTYLPVGSGERFEFYGGPQIIAASRALPHVDFAVMGVDSAGIEVPDNVTFLGRVTDPGPEYERASVVVRMVAHDAIGGTVMEGLLYGRHVVYSVPLAHTTTVAFGDGEGLASTLALLKGRHDAGELPVNDAGRSWALQEFDPDRRFAHLRDVVLDLVRHSRG